MARGPAYSALVAVRNGEASANHRPLADVLRRAKAQGSFRLSRIGAAVSAGGLLQTFSRGDLDRRRASEAAACPLGKDG